MAFPTTGILEDGSGADEDPLDTRWDGTHVFIGGDTGMLAKISNQLTNATGGGTDTSLGYDGASGSQQFSGDVEVWATIVTASTVVADQFKLLAMNARAGDVNADGYELHVEKSASTDIWQLRRRDNVTPTVLGADMNQEIASGDSVGISLVAGVLTAYYQSGAGAWTVIGTRSDSTYVGPWWIGIKTFQASPLAWKTVPFGGGTANSPNPFATSFPPVKFGPF
jgi:hypothetical protein